MITVQQYFMAYDGHKDITPAIYDNAQELLVKVNSLLEECIVNGWSPTENPATGSLISGQKNGGWRPPECPIGAPNSSHKQGRGVDVADADNTLDAVITDGMLEFHGLYREHPDDTVNWCHLTDRAPKSGRRTFKP
jgi:hypothetical protein